MPHATSASPPKRRGFLKGKLAGIAEGIVQFAESIGEVVSSAGELITDGELRRKGATFIVQEAAKSINEAQRGFEAGAETLQQGARARIGAGAQKLQSVMRNIERQIQEFQKQQQQRDLQSELEHHHKLPVDIQIGDQVFEDMPQEMRSRFWYVLLERPDLAQNLMKKHRAASRSGSAAPSSAEAASQPGTDPSAAAAEGEAGVSPPPSVPAVLPAAAASSSTAEGSEGHRADVDDAGRVSPEVPETPFAAYSTSPEPLEGGGPAEAAAAAPAVAAEESAPDIDDLLAQQSTGVLVAVDAPAAANGAAGYASAIPAAAAAGRDCDTSCSSSGAGHCMTAAAADCTPAAASPWSQAAQGSSNSSSDHAAGGGSSHSRGSSRSKPSAPNPWAQAAAGASGRGGDDAAASSTAPAGSTDPGAAAAAGPHAAAAGAASVGGDGDGWEIVSGDVPSVPPGAAAGVGGDLEAIDSLRSLVHNLAQEGSLDAARAAQASVFQAMLEVPWLPGEGIPQEYDADGEYGRLLAAGCGSVEDVIVRDVPRTFPEHPLFTASQPGQQRLLRLLKAYAAADPEVGYCQGMAFAAGVLLMYLPEEPAFRLFRRIMVSGPTLRRLYLPGLESLKMELSRFELLLSTHHPQLHQHLLDAGLPALLYAAQWLMTTYSCPFPMHVAARVLDVLLQSDSDAVLMRLGLAVMGALQERLLELDDFEALITHLKVKPLSWPMHTHRKVINDALHSPASDAELAAASAAVTAEFQRIGRFSSFSSHRLGRQDTGGSGAAADPQRLDLVPGTHGPRTEASAEAAEAAAAARAAGDSCSSCSSTGSLQQQQEAAEQPEGGAAAAASLSSSTCSLRQQQQQQGDADTPGAACAQDSGVLGELDAALIGLMEDMVLTQGPEEEGQRELKMQ